MGQFIRLEMMIGTEKLDILSKAHIAVVGIGGVGSYAVEALARSGVGEITILDHDRVGESNLNRQLCALHSTQGEWKAEVMAARAKDINPEIKVNVKNEYYSADTRDILFSASYDYIIDAIDLVSCKLDLIMSAKERELPIISALGTGNKLDATQLRVADISKTENCPLARVIRKELRYKGIKHHKVVYSPEYAAEPLPLETPPPGRRSIPASVAWVPGAAGLILAGEAVMDILGITPKR